MKDNQDNIIFQDIINKNEIAAGNSIRLIETSLTEIGVETSTQTETGGLLLRELQGLDEELRTISGSLRYFHNNWGRFSSRNYPNQYPKRNKHWKNLASKMGFSMDRIQWLELTENQARQKQKSEKISPRKMR